VTPVNQTDVVFLCFVYPLADVDQAQLITLPGRCNSAFYKLDNSTPSDVSNDVEGNF